LLSAVFGIVRKDQFRAISKPAAIVAAGFVMQRRRLSLASTAAKRQVILRRGILS
jgi:hypothetical protein